LPEGIADGNTDDGFRARGQPREVKGEGAAGRARAASTDTLVVHDKGRVFAAANKKMVNSAHHGENLTARAETLTPRELPKQAMAAHSKLVDNAKPRYDVTWVIFSAACY
jgi:hypothetical protein